MTSKKSLSVKLALAISLLCFLFGCIFLALPKSLQKEVYADQEGGFNLCNGESILETKPETNPTWDHYVFAGWYDAEVGGTELTGEPVDGTTYYAHWWTNNSKDTLVLTKGVVVYGDGLHIDNAGTATDLSAYGLAFTQAQDKTPATLTMTNVVIDTSDGVQYIYFYDEIYYEYETEDYASPIYSGLCISIDLNLVLNGKNTVRITKTNNNNATPIAIVGSGGVDVTISGGGTLLADASNAEGRNVFGLCVFGTLTNSSTVTGKSGVGTYTSNGVGYDTLNNTAGTLTGIGGTGKYTSGLNCSGSGDTTISGGKAVGHGGPGEVEYYGLWTPGNIIVSGNGVLELYSGTLVGDTETKTALCVDNYYNEENPTASPYPYITISASGKIVADSTIKNDGKYAGNYNVIGANKKAVNNITEGLELTKKTGTENIELSGIFSHVHNEGAATEISFTPWIDETSLPTEAGDYVLTCDVILSSTWTVPEGTTNLCLNGHVITSGAFDIGTSATLNLYDCGTTSHDGYVDSTGLWHLDANNKHSLTTGETSKAISGGVITGVNNPFGGCVTVSGTFNMYGGNIAGNAASGFKGGINGGGVNVASSGTFAMIGGMITGNTAVGAGGGVYNNGTMVVGGTAQITGNTANGATNNVYLPSVKTILLGTNENAPTTMKVGITLQNGTGAFTTNGTVNDEKYFVADDPNKHIGFGNNVLNVFDGAPTPPTPPTPGAGIYLNTTVGVIAGGVAVVLVLALTTLTVVDRRKR